MAGSSPGANSQSSSTAARPDTAPYASHYVSAAKELGKQLRLTVAAVSVRRADEIESAIAGFARSAPAALIVLPNGGFTGVNRTAVIEAPARHHLPAIYGARVYVASGGLMSYGADLTGQFRDGSEYVDRILRALRRPTSRSGSRPGSTGSSTLRLPMRWA